MGGIAMGKGMKKTKGRQGAKQHKEGENARPLIDH